MMELNREQIIKALECCVKVGAEGLLGVDCEECPYAVGEDDCKSLVEYALALIKELTEQVELLGSISENYQEELEELDDANMMQSGEIERRIAEVATLQAIAMQYQRRFESARADTVREMAERLKGRKVSYGNISFRVVPIDDIDQIAKEMLGEEK